ncbi:MAG: HlyD family type I secretion periplasmic adaptor subunit [Roseateles sp.]|uniref:HlyD family type I secretion periplasmic adaptor subunit n=1 Tax=Roseateles sp. TaxID=1971397 RepID=UPI0039EAD955
MTDTAPTTPADPLDQPPGTRRTLQATAGLLAAFVVWGALCKLDIASHSAGEVVTSGQTKLVQHLEGGIVRRLLVREGQAVQAGDALAELERSASDAELRELEAHIGGLQIRILRLEAQLAGRASFDVPAALAAKFPEQVRTARELFESQRQRLAGNLEVQGFKVSQRDGELNELQARREHLQGKLKLLGEQIAISEKLLKDGLANQYEHLNLLKELEMTRGALNETVASLGRIATGRRLENASLRTLASSDREQMHKDLEDARKQLAEFQERSSKYTDSQRRTVVRAPIAGTVMTMNVVTEGGVVPPGGTLMSLVPAGERLLVEARLPVGDVGLVHPGQPARLQLMSASARGFQPVAGTVIDISPDSVVEQGKEPYYRVRIEPARREFLHDARRYPLVPGVMVSVAILAGERSVLGYVFDPLTSGMRIALTEP